MEYIAIMYHTFVLKWRDNFVYQLVASWNRLQLPSVSLCRWLHISLTFTDVLTMVSQLIATRKVEKVQIYVLHNKIDYWNLEVATADLCLLSVHRSDGKQTFFIDGGIEIVNFLISRLWRWHYRGMLILEATKLGEMDDRSVWFFTHRFETIWNSFVLLSNHFDRLDVSWALRSELWPPVNNHMMDDINGQCIGIIKSSVSSE